MGHSLSIADMPDFQEIVKKTDKHSVMWKVSFHNPKELHMLKIFYNFLAIDMELIHYSSLNFNVEKNSTNSETIIDSISNEQSERSLDDI